MWPTRREVRVRVWTFQRMRVLSREAEARTLPELQNLTQEMADWWEVRVFTRR